MEPEAPLPRTALMTRNRAPRAAPAPILLRTVARSRRLLCCAVLAAAAAALVPSHAAAQGTFSPALPSQAPTGPNRTYFGQDIYVAANQRVHNAVCIFCSVQVEGELSGRALVLFGNLTVSGRVDRSVVVVGGNAVVDGAARILGSTSVIAGNAVYESDESLSGDALVLGGHVSNLAGPRVRKARRLALGPVTASCIALVGLLLLLPLWYVRRPAEARGSS